MRFALAVILGRLVRFAGKFIGRSTTLPGRIALRLDHAFLKKMKFDGKVIAVTGSNGKTTTQNLVAHILRENGYTVINNTEGSNLLPVLPPPCWNTVPWAVGSAVTLWCWKWTNALPPLSFPRSRWMCSW